MKRFLHYLVVKGIVIALVSTGAIAEDRLSSTTDELPLLQYRGKRPLRRLQLSRTILIILFILR